MKILRNCGFCLKTVFRYVPFNTLAAMICLFVPATFAGFQVLLLQRIVDNALVYVRGGNVSGGAEAMEAMVMWGICLVALLTLGTSMQRIGAYQMDLASVKLMERMAPDIARRLTELEYASFEQQETQELFQKMSGSPETGIFNCCLSTMFVIQRTISLFFSMAVIFAISPWMGLGIIVIGIPMMLLGYYAAGHSMTMMEEGADARRRMVDLKSLLTNKHAMFEMKLFDAAQLFGEKWNHYSTEYADMAMRENREVMKLDICSRFLNVIYLVFVVFMAAAGLPSGSLTLGQFTAALNGVAGIGSGLNDGSRQVIWLFANAMGIRYYLDFLKLETRKDLGTVEKLSYYDIAFENVSFRYPGTERDILKNVTFYAKEGERIAFVGENGAGKSTIIKLLCGLYEPTTGNVTIGGVPVREISPKLRTHLISVVFQNFQSYQMTLRENVAFGNPEALWDDEKLLHALELAGAEELATPGGNGEETKEAEMKGGDTNRADMNRTDANRADTKRTDTKGMDARGLDRNLGRLEKDGQDLSRGQWQRIAMARAFVSDAKYVVLDEPTASLDPLAESRMYGNFARIFRERGTVLISHRLASARMADRILVLDGGRIVQTGNHEELMAEEGLYRTMFLAQSSFYQDGEPKGQRREESNSLQWEHLFGKGKR